MTFIIRERDGGRSAGYISAGFFGGLTLGRIALMWFNRMVGPQKVIFIYIVLVIAYVHIFLLPFCTRRIPLPLTAVHTGWS